MTDSDPYLSTFEGFNEEVNENYPEWVSLIRKAGISQYGEIGFPTTKQEDWRFTNVSPISKLPLKPLFLSSNPSVDPEILKIFPFSELEGIRLVFLNGHFAPELSRVDPLESGIHIQNLKSGLKHQSELIKPYLTQIASNEEISFTALNSAFFQDGAFIMVPDNQVIEKPIHLVNLTTIQEEGVAIHPRNLIVVGDNSKLTVLESFVSQSSGVYFNNVVTEFVVGNNTSVEHCKFQDESLEAYHIASLYAKLGRGCNFRSHSIALGSRLSRYNIRTRLDGERLECVLNGVYLTRGKQLADHHMVVDHAKPHCGSYEYFNGILDDQSKGVFHGRILVRPDAQKTDAKQTNKNLLLSEDSRAHSKPQLEIYADDVKCTHGATIGQMDEDSIFYLRSRGIGLEMARRILIHSFAGEIIDRIQNPSIREELDQLIWDRLEKTDKSPSQI